MSIWRAFTGIANPVRVVWVTTKTGATLKGLMVERTRDVMVLRAAAVGTVDNMQGEVWTKMQGDVVVPMDNVDYWQEGLQPESLE